MNKEHMLSGVEDGEVNIGSVLSLLDELESLPQSELRSFLDEIEDKEATLRDLQKSGVDTPAIRNALSRLSVFREKAG